MIAFSPAMVLFLLLAGHAVADFSLQNDYVANAKNRNTPHGKDVWWMVLPAHALIHGAMVALVTGSVVLALLETIFHGMIDFAKCDGEIGYAADQIMHVVCKFVWWTAWLMLIYPAG